jgi:hypothetical protein
MYEEVRTTAGLSEDNLVVFDRSFVGAHHLLSSSTSAEATTSDSRLGVLDYESLATEFSAVTGAPNYQL